MQLVDLTALKSHQLGFAECPISVSNMKFLHTFFDDSSWEYTVATISREKQVQSEETIFESP